MASGRQRSGAARNERIYQKIVNSVANGHYYEASQLAKTLFFRYKLQKRYDDAAKLLYDTSVLLLKNGQIESGIDLSRQLVKCYSESTDEVREEFIDKVSDVLNLCDEDCTSRKDLIRESLLWSASKYKHGNPKIHQTVAVKYWEEKNYEAARQHFLHTTEGSLYATFLVEYHVMAGYPSEIDMFVTQAVLQVLCLQNTPTANILFFTYTEKHPGIRRKVQPYKHPLLNFLAFLLITLEIGSLQQFTTLCEQYQPSISRDPVYFQYLDKIGQLFFGLPPKEKKKQGGIMGVIDDLMHSMMGENAVEQAEMAIEPSIEDID